MIGKLMGVFGWVGLLLSGLILICTPFMLHRASSSFSIQLETLSTSLISASENLAAQDATLKQLDGVLSKTASITGEIEGTLTDVTPLLDDMATFLGDQMPVTLSSTESSLRSASEGAAAIDSLLRILSRIPFLDSIEYNPGQSLDASLVQAADGLAPIADPLIELQQDLNTFSASLKEMRMEIGGTESNLDSLRGRMKTIKDALTSGSDRLGELAEAIDQLNERIPVIAVTMGIIIGWSAIWFALVNTVLILQAEKLVNVSEQA